MSEFQYDKEKAYGYLRHPGNILRQAKAIKEHTPMVLVYDVCHQDINFFKARSYADACLEVTRGDLDEAIKLVEKYYNKEVVE